MSGPQVVDLDNEIYNYVSKNNFPAGKGSSVLFIFRLFFVCLVLVEANLTEV